MLIPIKLTVNGDSYELRADSRWTLLDVLRNALGLTGSKFGCGYGVCGACTVLLDGKAVNACLVLAVQADGGDVLTVEGLSRLAGDLHPLQRAFIERGAFQCGYCTSGMLMSAHALLTQNPNPSEDEIRRALVGNLCRCTGYVNYVSSVAAVAAGREHPR